MRQQRPPTLAPTLQFKTLAERRHLDLRARQHGGELAHRDFLAHADQAERLAWHRHTAAPRTFLTHGDAGALGKPVWLLNRFDNCWRWLIGRDDTPWYPTMRLFRQPRPGDWQSVVAAVASELGRLA